MSGTSAGSVKAGAGKPQAAAPLALNLRTLWPLPVLLLSGGLLAGALVTGWMKRPKEDPGLPLAEIRASLEAGEYEGAIGKLNGLMVPRLQAGVLSPEQEQEVFRLRAWALAQGQKELGVALPENFTAILSDLEAAVKAGAELTLAERVLGAEAALGRGDLDRAVELAKGLPVSASRERGQLLRQMVAANMAAGPLRREQSLALLGELMDLPGLSHDDRGWALARQTELRLSMGFAEEALTRILRTLPTLSEASGSVRGELLLLLGRAYFEEGQLAEASNTLEMAERALPEGDPGRAHGQVLLGRILQSGGRHEEARERFAAVYREGPNMASGPSALFGVAQTTATLGDDEQALELYGRLIEDLRAGGGRTGPTLEEVGESLMERQTDRAQREEHRLALQYALAAESAYRAAVEAVGGKAGAGAAVGGKAGEGGKDHAGGKGDEGGKEHGGGGPEGDKAEAASVPPARPAGVITEVPPEVTLAVAANHRRVAEKILSDALSSPTGRLTIDQVSPVTAAEAKRHLLDAGAAFRQHGMAVAAGNNSGYAESLWNAADCYDLAGDHEAAKGMFAAYSQTTPDTDPRKAESRFRLAQIFQAEREWKTAAEQYRAVIEARNAAEEGGAGTGIFADRSLVPLAQCYLADGDPANDAEAESLLRSVLGGSMFTPEAEEYRQALVAMGEMLHERGRWNEAIERLEEAVRRYVSPDAPSRDTPAAQRAVGMLFRLADSYRRSALDLAKELDSALPQTRRDEVTMEVRRRLSRAGDLFRQVGDTVGQIEERRLTRLDKLHRRNAAFYMADTAFEMGDLEAAIRQYEAAAQVYSSDPASLVARMQIVAAHVRLGRWREAAAANERAKRQLATIPDTAFDQPDMPMRREHWERWVEAEMLLAERARQTANVPTGGGGG